MLNAWNTAEMTDKMLPSNAFKTQRLYKEPSPCGGVDNGGASLPGHGHHGPDRAVESNLDPGHQVGEQHGRQLQVRERYKTVSVRAICLINLIN